MSYDNQAVEIISKAISEAADKKLSAAFFDKTYLCTVIEIIDKNTYLVTSEGMSFTVQTKNIPSLKIMDTVHVLFSKNNPEQKIVLEDLGYPLEDLTDIIKQINNLKSTKENVFSKNTAFNKNFETSASNIKPLGTVSTGSSSNIARADHVHPVSATPFMRIWGTSGSTQSISSDAKVLLSNTLGNDANYLQYNSYGIKVVQEGFYEVSAMLMFNSSTNVTNVKSLSIFKDNARWIWVRSRADINAGISGNPLMTLVFPPLIDRFTAGQTIYMYARDEASGGGVIDLSGGVTQLQVKYVSK